MRSESPLLHEARLRIFDQYQSEWPREYRPVPVRVVVIDDESLSRIGQWPWPRSVMRDLVVRLGGESRLMTFLFSDIAGFTALTETTDPQRLVAVGNAYLKGACGVVLKHGGTIDKIVGDALHVMFNAPTDQPDHAARGEKGIDIVVERA